MLGVSNVCLAMHCPSVANYRKSCDRVSSIPSNGVMSYGRLAIMCSPPSTRSHLLSTASRRLPTIGTFTKSENGYADTVRTLNVSVKVVPVAPGEKTSDKSPDYRVLAGNYDLDAAWAKTSRADNPYLSVTLDDPSFPSTIDARLIEGEDGSYSLI